MDIEDQEARCSAELVQRVQAGEHQAENEIVERYSAGLLQILRRLTRDPSQADDLHQETFQLVLEKLRAGALRDPEKLAAFLRSTGRNLFLAGIRKTKRQQDKLQEDYSATVAHSMQTAQSAQLGSILRREEAAQVRQLLSELGSERDRQVLFRFYIADEEKACIRRDLDLTPLQFNRVLHRSRQRFKELWQRASMQTRRPR